MPFERTLDRSTIEQLFSAAANSGSIPDEDPRRPKMTRRQLKRRLITIGVVLAVVLGAAGAGWAWTDHAAKQPALKALGVADKAFEPAVEKLRLASDLEELRDAATGANAAADRVDSAGRSIARPSSDIERRVQAVLRGETELLRAAAPMATLDTDSLAQWPAMRTRLADAEADLESDVRRLGNLDADAGRSVRTGLALAVRTDEMVASFAETTAIERLAEHLSGLTRALTTRQVRAAAQTTESSDAVAQVLAGVDESTPQGTQLVGISDTLEVIGRLTKLDGDHLRLWKPIRADLVSVSDLEGVDIPSAVSAVDALVTGAQAKLRGWRTAKEQAIARTERDTERVNSYLESVRPVLKVFDAMTARSAEFSRRVQRGEKGGVTYPDASAFLDQTRKDLTWVRTALDDTSKLPRLRKEHVAVVASVDFGSTAVAGGYEGIGRPLGCITRSPKRPADPKAAPVPEPVCYYAGSLGWARFSLGWAQAVQAFATARTALDDAAREHIAAIEARELPKKPVV